jgi:exodeoxyribonuclease-1
LSFNNLIFYDTETTGIQKDFSQILQCGSVLTDSSLTAIDEQNIGCAPLPWVIPQPMAMLTNKKIDLFNSNTSHYQMMKDLQSNGNNGLRRILQFLLLIMDMHLMKS